MSYYNDDAPLLPAGRYRVRARRTDFGVSSQKMTPFVSVTFEVTAGDHAGSEVEWKGYFSEKTQAGAIKDLLTLGFPGNDPEELAGNHPELVPNEVEIVVEHETYRDQTRERVRWINPVGGSAAGGPKLDLRAAFAAARKEAGVNGKPVTPKPAPAPLADDGSDVPF